MLRVRSLVHKLALSVIVLALFLLVLPAVAQEDGSTTTTAATGTTLSLTPAVPVEPPAEAPATADWTYRYLIPTGLALAGLVILLTSIRYFTNVVRKRYRIAGE